jgi:DNA-directed RNA polymerase subunit RPC12/RpoP
MDETLIRFSCGNCKQRYKADESFAGDKITCRKCGTDVPVPAAPLKPAEPVINLQMPKLTLPKKLQQN